jgi:hypothetical protein
LKSYQEKRKVKLKEKLRAGHRPKYSVSPFSANWFGLVYENSFRRRKCCCETIVVCVEFHSTKIPIQDSSVGENINIAYNKSQLRLLENHNYKYLHTTFFQHIGYKLAQTHHLSLLAQNINKNLNIISKINILELHKNSHINTLSSTKDISTFTQSSFTVIKTVYCY